MLSRRDLLVVGAGASLAGGCNRLGQVAKRPLPATNDLPENPGKATRLAHRAGFGPRPGQLAAMEEMGLDAWVDRQLKPTDMDDPKLMLTLARFEALSADATELEDLQEPAVLRQLGTAAILRATYSDWQVRERMVDFWTNHFNVYAKKAHGAYRRPTEDLKVIRQHALGSFPEMLAANAKSPGMLMYLDNQVNRKGTPNENYARELMELHTLGVHGGYSQHDVMEVARCLTGWTVENRFLRPKGKFRFDPDLHDAGEKLVLGHKIPAGGGIEDGEMVLSILARHPNTARFVSQKLCLHFLGTADSTWVEKLSDIYLKTNGSIPAMLKPLLLSDDLLTGPAVGKRPLDFVVSALRVTGAETDGEHALDALEAMGQPLYDWPMPDGFPQSPSAWSGSMLARWNFAHDLGHAGIKNTTIDLGRFRGDRHLLAENVLGKRLDHRQPLAKTIQKSTTPEMACAVALASPEFQYR